MECDDSIIARATMESLRSKRVLGERRLHSPLAAGFSNEAEGIIPPVLHDSQIYYSPPGWR